MKKIILTLIILFCCKVLILSQGEKFTIRTGIGYYMDVFTAYDGPIIWIDGGYKFNTGFILNSRFSSSSMEYKLREGPFKDYSTLQLRQMVDITFSKAIRIHKENFVEPGVGFKFKKEYLLKPSFSFIPSSGNSTISTRYSEIFYEIGFTLCLDYYHQFSSGFYMGLRADTNVIWALGFEGLTFSPLFGFRF